MRHYLLLVSFFLIKMTGSGQNYYAVQGSSYAGSLGVANNPASIVNTPFPWDITVVGFQVKGITNAFTVHNYSLLSPPSKAAYEFNRGTYGRYAHANANVNLLNARIAINRQSAFAIGMNIRSYTRAKTGPYNFIDTLSGLDDFFKLNNNSALLHGDVLSSSWLELFGTYSRTIFDNYRGRLNAGVTLKLSRGLSGAHGGLGNIRIDPKFDGESVSVLVSGDANYGYSSNFDVWKSSKSTMQNIKDFITTAQGGISVDVGVEYLIKPSGFVFFGEDEDYFGYDWKIGLSLLDLGFNQYKYSHNSRVVSGIRDNMTGELVNQKLGNPGSIAAFNDSLAGVVRNMRRLSGKFNVINPARMVLNVDRFLFDAFYVNGDLSINLSPLAGDQRFYAKETNFLTVTPRWETRLLGFYLPMQYNTEKKFWVGAAAKAGPLLFGLHNLAYLFAKNKITNGGGYLAIVIKPGRKKETERNKKDRSLRRYDCPVW